MVLAAVDSTAELRDKLKTRTAPIGIIGMGYVGRPLALLFCEERLPLLRIRHRPLQS